MELRELTEADLPALAELCRHGLSDPLDEALLRRFFLREPDVVAGYQLALVDENRLAGAILGGVRERPEGLVAGVRLVLVAPELRRRGLGGQLLAELERRIRADGIAELWVGGIGPNYLWPGLDVQRHTPAYCFFERHGFARFWDAINMDVDLTARDWAAGLAATALADGWEVRRATNADKEPLLAWVRANWSPAWVFEAELTFSASTPTVMLAVRGDQIGGFACWDVSGFWGTFGPTGTAEALRGRGLGKALLIACFAAMRAQGYRSAEIGWTGPIAFYARAADARIGRVCWFMKKPLTP